MTKFCPAYDVCLGLKRKRKNNIKNYIINQWSSWQIRKIFYIEKTTFATVLPFCGQDGQATELM